MTDFEAKLTIFADPSPCPASPGVRHFCKPAHAPSLKGARALGFSLQGVRGRGWAEKKSYKTVVHPQTHDHVVPGLFNYIKRSMNPVNPSSLNKRFNGQKYGML